MGSLPPQTNTSFPQPHQGRLNVPLLSSHLEPSFTQRPEWTCPIQSYSLHLLILLELSQKWLPEIPGQGLQPETHSPARLPQLRHKLPHPGTHAHTTVTCAYTQACIYILNHAYNYMCTCCHTQAHTQLPVNTSRHTCTHNHMCTHSHIQANTSAQSEAPKCVCTCLYPGTHLYM